MQQLSEPRAARTLRSLVALTLFVQISCSGRDHGRTLVRVSSKEPKKGQFNAPKPLGVAEHLSEAEWKKQLRAATEEQKEVQIRGLLKEEKHNLSGTAPMELGLDKFLLGSKLSSAKKKEILNLFIAKELDINAPTTVDGKGKKKHLLYYLCNAETGKVREAIEVLVENTSFSHSTPYNYGVNGLTINKQVSPTDREALAKLFNQKGLIIQLKVTQPELNLSQRNLKSSVTNSTTNGASSSPKHEFQRIQLKKVNNGSA